jgi:hypothetical protein
MSTSVVRILIVGSITSSTSEILRKLAGVGWGSHSVSSVREAETVIKTIRFKIVLSAEKLPDGTGYELAALIGRQLGTLLIGVSLSETCLWLSVVEKGVRSLGKRAMNPTMLESELMELLRPLRFPEMTLEPELTRANAATGGLYDVKQAAPLAAAASADFMSNLRQNDSV